MSGTRGGARCVPDRHRPLTPTQRQCYGPGLPPDLRSTARCNITADQRACTPSSRVHSLSLCPRNNAVTSTSTLLCPSSQLQQNWPSWPWPALTRGGGMNATTHTTELHPPRKTPRAMLDRNTAATPRPYPACWRTTSSHAPPRKSSQCCGTVPNVGRAPDRRNAAPTRHGHHQRAPRPTAPSLSRATVEGHRAATPAGWKVDCAPCCPRIGRCGPSLTTPVAGCPPPRDGGWGPPTSGTGAHQHGIWLHALDRLRSQPRSQRGTNRAR